ELRGVNTWLRDHRVLIDLDVSVSRGEIVGIVGESGSGKTMTARTILRSLPDGARAEGNVLLDGVDLLKLSDRRMRHVLAHRIGAIFQDPRSHVDPLWTVGDYLTEGIRRHGGLGRDAARAKAVDLLRRVGI